MERNGFPTREEAGEILNRSFASLQAFAQFADRMAAEEIHADQLARRKVGERLRGKVKARLGKEHLLPPPLALSTRRERLSLGFSENETLLRTGALRESITEGMIEPRSSGVGSDLPYAPFHELGGRIPGRPPKRSYLASTARESDRELFELYVQWFRRRLGI